MPGALEGLRVVDMTTGLAGPLATTTLSDHGADVVKVEPPSGDPQRSYVGSVVTNRGKRSVVLDLDNASDRDRLLELAATADVLVELLAVVDDGLDPGACDADQAAVARSTHRRQSCLVEGNRVEKRLARVEQHFRCGSEGTRPELWQHGNDHVDLPVSRQCDLEEVRSGRAEQHGRAFVLEHCLAGLRLVADARADYDDLAAEP
jgi:hypothetical protein